MGIFKTLLFLLSLSLVNAQSQTRLQMAGEGVPIGACTSVSYVDMLTGALYNCVAGNYVEVELPAKIASITIAGLPAAANSTKQLYIVTDAQTPNTCSNFGGTEKVLCRSDGSIWESLGNNQTSVSGNAGTATALQTPRAINGVNFSGIANITIPLTSAIAGAGIGYTTGTGGVVTQLTSKSTGVTLNTLTGAVTMSAAALAAGVEVSFVVTNSTVANVDVPMIAIKSGGTAGSYLITVSAIASGSFTITVSNASAGSLSQAVIISFVIIKGAVN